MSNLRRIVAAFAVLASLVTFAAPASAQVPTVSGTLTSPSTNAAFGTFELLPASNTFGFFLRFTLSNGHILTVMPASMSPEGLLECTYIEYMLIGATNPDGTQGWQWSEVAGGRVTLNGATSTGASVDGTMSRTYQMIGWNRSPEPNPRVDPIRLTIP